MPRNQRVTRGEGLLEGFLARKRAEVANRLIPRDLRDGCVVDLGCGSYPFFLMHTQFKTRIGLDREVGPAFPIGEDALDLQFLTHDLEAEAPLPVAARSCEVVTMLAVIEHINPSRVMHLIREIHRILKPSGVVVLTTPAAWVDSLLRVMARLGLVSAVEINEHKSVYTRERLRQTLGQVFPATGLRFGFFELFMNLWAVARKEQ